MPRFGEPRKQRGFGIVVAASVLVSLVAGVILSMNHLPGYLGVLLGFGVVFYFVSAKEAGPRRMHTVAMKKKSKWRHLPWILPFGILLVVIFIHRVIMPIFT